MTVSSPAGAGLPALLADYGLSVSWVASGDAIPGSYWGEPEAGIDGSTLWLRDDTPLHSALHEAAHLICMGTERRARVHTDAGGDDPEECAVCYLQAPMADRLPPYDRQQLFADMDAWGYSFRLGSAAAWHRQDAEDARAWLLDHGLIYADGALAAPTPG